jgi:acyl-CoA synthetase (AMP-forming)/AMP-acid ligase II
MKKTLAAISAGLLLIAGQAAATATATEATARVGDRVGAQSENSSEFAGIPLIGLLAIAGVIAAAVVVVSDDDSESD